MTHGLKKHLKDSGLAVLEHLQRAADADERVNCKLARREQRHHKLPAKPKLTNLKSTSLVQRPTFSERVLSWIEHGLREVRLELRERLFRVA